MKIRLLLKALLGCITVSIALSFASCRSDQGDSRERISSTAQADSIGRTLRADDLTFTAASVRQLQRLANFNVPDTGTIYAQPIIVPNVPRDQDHPNELRTS